MRILSYSGVMFIVFFCGVVTALKQPQKDGEHFSKFFTRRSLQQSDEAPPECEFSNDIVYQEISGGIDAPVGRFPYIVSIQFERNGVFRHMCGGTLISQSLILTAAHCIYIQNSYDLRSSNSLQGNLVSSPILYAARAPLCRHQDGQGGRVKIKSYYLSSDYNGGPIGGGDIAVLETENPLKYSGPFINFDTTKVNFNNGGLFSALGYGATDKLDLNIERDDVSKLVPLQIGFLQYVKEDVCQADLLEFNTLYVLDEGGNICFGKQGVDTCPGDSGGPILLANDNYGVSPGGDPTQDVQVGITSWGPVVDCTPGDEGSPGVYTDVGYYTEWIKSIRDQTADGTSQVPLPITPLVQGCVDVAPPGKFSCDEQKRFGKCDKRWMLEGGYCKQTCSLCDLAPQARSSLQCLGEQQANYKGVIIKVGNQNFQDSAAECCQSCTDDPGCNVWVFCPKQEGCRNLDEILKFGRCDLKFQKVVAQGGVPEVYYRGNETDFTSGYLIGKTATGK